MRLINRYGGYDYWMFEKRQTFEREIKNVDTFEPHIADFSKARGTAVLIKKEMESKVTIGAEGLSANEWKILSFIADSPFAQWYNEEKDIWISIVVEKSKLVMQTSNALHSLELTIQLPTPQLAL
jgi:hypothetical protein